MHVNHLRVAKDFVKILQSGSAQSKTALFSACEKIFSGL